MQPQQAGQFKVLITGEAVNVSGKNRATGAEYSFFTQDAVLFVGQAKWPTPFSLNVDEGDFKEVDAEYFLTADSIVTDKGKLQFAFRLSLEPAVPASFSSIPKKTVSGA